MIRFTSAASLTLLLVASHATATEVFQVTFGTRYPDVHRISGSTDSGTHVVEATNGDIVVAGYGGSHFTDAGDRTHPMLARIRRDGWALPILPATLR